VHVYETTQSYTVNSLSQSTPRESQIYCHEHLNLQQDICLRYIWKIRTFVVHNWSRKELNSVIYNVIIYKGIEALMNLTAQYL
jgi:hypothetical protein